MCRGCHIRLKDDDSAGRLGTWEFLDWFGGYEIVVRRMREVERQVLAYRDKALDPEARKAIDRHYKRLVRARRKYCKSDHQFAREIYK